MNESTLYRVEICKKRREGGTNIWHLDCIIERQCVICLLPRIWIFSSWGVILKRILGIMLDGEIGRLWFNVLITGDFAAIGFGGYLDAPSLDVRSISPI